MVRHGIELDSEAIRGFCRKWKIAELQVFGSILRESFQPTSDVDFLVVFEEGDTWGLADLAEMERELGTIVGREVDLVERETVERSPNYIRRRSILSTAESVYARR